MLRDRFYKMHMLYMDEYTSCLDPVQEGFNPTQMGLFRAAHGWRGGRGGAGCRKALFSKICHAYAAMMKLGTLIPYQEKIQKYINHGMHPLSSADISIFSLEITRFWYIKKYRYKLHFDL